MEQQNEEVLHHAANHQFAGRCYPTHEQLGHLAGVCNTQTRYPGEWVKGSTECFVWLRQKIEEKGGQYVRDLMEWDEDKAVDDRELTSEYRTTPKWLATLVGFWLNCKYGEYILGNDTPGTWDSDDLEARLAFREQRQVVYITQNNTASALPYVKR